MSKKVFKLGSTSPCKTVEINYVWTIESFCLRNKDVMYSSTFSAPEDGQGKEKEWSLALYPNGCKAEDYVSVYLRWMDPDEDEFKVMYSFKLQDENGQCLKIRSSQIETFSKTLNSWGVSQFYKRNELVGKLPNNVLIVTCEFSYLNIVLENISGTNQTPATCGLDAIALKSDLSDDLGALLSGGGEFSDVILCVGDGEEERLTKFRAHRAILVARSPYFAAMFRNDFREKHENRVRIDDVKPKIFRDVMAFIYTGKEPEFMAESVAKEVLVAADRFALDKLKSLAENVLVSKVTMENVLELLAFADAHSAEALEKRANDFVAANVKKIMKTEEWKLMIQEHHAAHLSLIANESLAGNPDSESDEGSARVSKRKRV